LPVNKKTKPAHVKKRTAGKETDGVEKKGCYLKKYRGGEVRRGKKRILHIPLLEGGGLYPLFTGGKNILYPI